MQRKKIIIILLVILSGNSYALGQFKVDKVERLPKKMYETSGLIWYNNEIFITHNDGGNKSEIFLLDTEGKYIKTINLKDTKNNDWEDITQDSQGNVYIGDFGNNLNSRKECQIYILKKGFIDKDDVKPEKIEFQYPSQEKFPPKKSELNYDCEAMIWKDGYIYVFTKCRTEPYTGVSKIYKIKAEKGKQTPILIGEIKLCKRGWRSCSITAADYNAETNTLLLLTYTKLYAFRGFSTDEFWKGKTTVYNFSFMKQREAICFKEKGIVFMTDEYHPRLKGGNIYKIKY